MLYTDAGPVGLGLVLVQEQDSENRVICYASLALTSVERRYCQTKKEALAIVWACERLHPYLFGAPFTLMTDHRALEVIYGDKKKKSSARIERWVLRLQAYDFQVRYVKGALNIADSLSRLMKGSSGDAGSEKTAIDSVEDVELYVRNCVTGAISDLEAITPGEVERAPDADTELSCVGEAISSDRLTDLPRQYKPIRDEMCVLGQLVMRGGRIVVPACLRQKLLSLGYEGHLGIVGTKHNLRTRVWWPGMDANVERLVKQCHGCKVTGAPLQRDPVRVTELPIGPWEHLAVDLLKPLANGDNILVVVDYYSRWYEVKIMKSTVTSKIIEALQAIFDIHGLPVSIKSDNSLQFVAEEFASYLKSMGIRHHLVTSWWPEANGEVERQNSSINKRIRIALSEGNNYKSEQQKYITACRNTRHSITGKSPAEILFGRKLRTKLPQMRDVIDDLETRARDGEQKPKMVGRQNTKLRPYSLRVGDMVLGKRDNLGKSDMIFYPTPFTIREVQGPMVVDETEQGRIFRRNVPS